MNVSDELVAKYDEIMDHTNQYVSQLKKWENKFGTDNFYFENLWKDTAESVYLHAGAAVINLNTGACYDAYRAIVPCINSWLQTNKISLTLRFSAMFYFANPKDFNKVTIYSKLTDLQHNSTFSGRGVDVLGDDTRANALLDKERKIRKKLPQDKLPPIFTDKDMALSTLNSVTELTLVRFLTRYTNLPKKITDDGIASIATEIIAQNKPLELQWCDSKQDYINMYEQGPSSCMTGGGGGRDWDPLYKTGSHPVLWYYYCPTTLGVYIKRSGRIIARTIVFIIEGKKYHGRVFGLDGDSRSRLLRTLHSNGIGDLGSKYDKAHGYFAECEFTIPPVTYMDEQFYPWPYFDNINGGVSVSVDKKTKELKVTMGPKVELRCPNLHSASGLISYSTVQAYRKAKCVVCGSSVSTDMLPLCVETNICGHDCAQKFSCIYTVRIDGSAFWKHKSEVEWVDDRVKTSPTPTGFTTYAAGYRNGCGLLLTNVPDTKLRSSSAIIDYAKRWRHARAETGKFASPDVVFGSYSCYNIVLYTLDGASYELQYKRDGAIVDAAVRYWNNQKDAGTIKDLAH